MMLCASALILAGVALGLSITAIYRATRADDVAALTFTRGRYGSPPHNDGE